MLKKIYHVLGWLSLIGLIILPTIVTYNSLLPFHLMKWLVIVGGAVMLVIVGVGIALKEKRRLYTHPIVLALGVLVLARLVSGMLGIDPFKSFWGDGLRLGGTTIWILITALVYGIGVWLSEHPKKVTRIFWTMLVSGFLTSIMGWLIQYNSGLFGVEVGTSGISGRFIGLHGNATYFAAHVMMAVFGGVALLHEKTSRVQKLCAILLTSFVILTVIVAKTRAASVGLLVGILVYGFYWVLTLRSRVIKLAGMGVLIACALLGSLYVVSQRQFFGTIRTAASAVFSVETLGTRYYLWHAGLQGLRANPVFGIGPENYEILFDRTYDPRMLKISGSLHETWGERPHNLYVEYLSSQGVVGLLVFLALLGCVLHAAYRSKKGSGYAMGGMVVAYATYGFFTFDTPSLLAFLCLGLAVLVSYSIRPITTDPRVRSGAYGVLLVVSLVFLGVGVVLPARAALAGARVQTQLYSMPTVNLKQDVQTAASSIYRRDALKLIGDELINNHSRIQEPSRDLVARALFTEFEIETVRNSHLFSLTLRKAQIAGIIAAGTSNEFDRASYKAIALKGFDDARVLSPGRQVVDLAEVRMLLDLGDTEEAAKFSANLEKNGTNEGIFLYLQALVEAANGNTAKAAQFMARAIDDNVILARHPDVIEYVITLLETENDYEHIVLVLQLALESDGEGKPLDSGIYDLKLAYALANLGRYSEARGAATRALERDPALEPQVRAFIEALSNQNH